MMFSWFRKKRPAQGPATNPAPPPPPVSPPARQAAPDQAPPRSGNPGRGTSLRVAFANGQRTWNENLDLLELAERALTARGHKITRCKDHLELTTTELKIRPQIVEVIPLDRGGVRTVSTIEIRHVPAFPNGVFEYQHSIGESTEDALLKGFDQWAQIDLVVLLDSLRDKPQTCMTLEMKSDTLKRRAVLGPVAHFARERAAPISNESGEDHPFCACCFLTNNFETFKPFIESNDFFAIRFYAARDQDGAPSADCRINGEEFEPGKESLRKYIEKWPQAGFEFRKQYIVLQTTPDPLSDDKRPSKWRE